MTRIRVEVAGDQWINRTQVIENIASAHQASHLVFELNTEGPSLHALGIIEAISQAIAKIGIMPDRVWIDCWHNALEPIPFRRAFRPAISHFFWLSEEYRHSTHAVTDTAVPLAFFVGRLVLERAVMLFDLYHEFPQRILLSLMQQHPLPHFLHDDMSAWMPSAQHPQFLHWCETPPVNSITNHWVRDQYKLGQNTNRDLIQHYGGFYVELVAETYCKGDAFFPTEKTVRPLSQGKPVVVFGPQHFLARLRALGFRTWHDIWDESYDDLTGSARWSAMKRTLHTVVDQMLYLDHRLQSISCHNKANLDRLILQHRPG